MNIIDSIIFASRQMFNLKVLTFDIFDILFVVSSLPNFPRDEDGEELELETYGIMELTDNKLVFYTGGEFQKPMEIIVEVVNNVPRITGSSIISDFYNYKTKELDEDTIYNFSGLAKL